MEEPTAGSGQLASSSKELARRLLTIGENRLELLTVEVQEQRERLLRVVLLALGVAVFGLLAGMTLTAAIVVLFWPSSPATVLVILTVLYGAAAGLVLPALMGLLRDWRSLPRLAGSTPKGPRMSGKNPRLNALQSRKQLLLAESELNRALMLQDVAALTSEFRHFTDHAKSFGSIASAGAALVGGLAAVQRGKSARAGTRLSWVRIILKAPACFPPSGWPSARSVAGGTKLDRRTNSCAATLDEILWCRSRRTES